jgi:3-oxoacyl-[acyl-carrier protein] reductase
MTAMTTQPPPVRNLLNLEGKNALVTGSSGNIGRGIALRLAEAGACVLVHYFRDAEGAKCTVDEIHGGGGAARLLQADLSCEADACDLVTSFDGDIHCVVNNAATQPVSDIRDIGGEDWRQVLATNLDSAFYVTQAVARYMCEQKISGAIVNITSIEGSDPARGHSHYATSKAGLLMLTRACALEYGSDGIRFNSVSPGLIDRDGLSASWPEGVERWLGNVPLGRMGMPADIADAVLFLLSPASRWITGANLVVDGGMSSVSRW